MAWPMPVPPPVTTATRPLNKPGRNTLDTVAILNTAKSCDQGGVLFVLRLSESFQCLSVSSLFAGKHATRPSHNKQIKAKICNK